MKHGVHLLTVSPSALRRSFNFDARVPAGVKHVTIAVDRVENFREISERTQRIIDVIYKFYFY